MVVYVYHERPFSVYNTVEYCITTTLITCVYCGCWCVENHTKNLNLTNPLLI